MEKFGKKEVFDQLEEILSSSFEKVFIFTQKNNLSLSDSAFILVLDRQEKQKVTFRDLFALDFILKLQMNCQKLSLPYSIITF